MNKKYYNTVWGLMVHKSGSLKFILNGSKGSCLWGIFVKGDSCELVSVTVRIRSTDSPKLAKNLVNLIIFLKDFTRGTLVGVISFGTQEAQTGFFIISIILESPASRSLSDKGLKWVVTIIFNIHLGIFRQVIRKLKRR